LISAALSMTLTAVGFVVTTGAGGHAAAADAGPCVPLEQVKAEAAALRAAADPTVADIPDGGPAAQRATELEDIKTSAAERGIPLADAYRQLCWQSEFSAIVDQVEATYPDSFAGAWIVRTGPDNRVDGAVVQFKGAVPGVVARRLGKFDVGLRPNRGFSEKELLARLDNVHNGFKRAGYTDLTSSYDLADGTIEVEAVPLPGQSGRSARLQRAQLPASLRAPDIQVTFREALPGGATSAVHGGGKLEFTGGNSLKCTGAFNVRKGTVKGLTSAWHCKLPFTFKNLNGAHEYRITHRGAHGGQWGDFRWFSVSGSETDDFYWTWGNNRRDVQSVRHSRLGEELCRFGRRTGRMCGDHVYKKNVSRTHDGRDLKRMTIMHRMRSDKGDSGGPWYWGRAAIGVHHGWKRVHLIRRDMFSEAGRLDEALGVTVLK
jgi:hypothetical protein